MSNKLLQILSLKEIRDDCRLVVADHSSLPFKFKRSYIILDPVKDLPRGYHAHYKNIQAIFCLKGRANLILDNGYQRESIVLSEPNKGILLDKMIWHEMHNLDEDTILMVLASHEYDEHDYIRSYADFMKIARRK